MDGYSPVTDEHESAVLGVPPHSPSLLFDVTTRDKLGRIDSDLIFQT
jgi:hypothetical protein